MECTFCKTYDQYVPLIQPCRCTRDSDRGHLRRRPVFYHRTCLDQMRTQIGSIHQCSKCRFSYLLTELTWKHSLRIWLWFFVSLILRIVGPLLILFTMETALHWYFFSYRWCPVNESIDVRLEQGNWDVALWIQCTYRSTYPLELESLWASQAAYIQCDGSIWMKIFRAILISPWTFVFVILASFLLVGIYSVFIDRAYAPPEGINFHCPQNCHDICRGCDNTCRGCPSEICGTVLVIIFIIIALVFITIGMIRCVSLAVFTMLNIFRRQMQALNQKRQVLSQQVADLREYEPLSLITSLDQVFPASLTDIILSYLHG